jgi:hypothetical protein
MRALLQRDFCDVYLHTVNQAGTLHPFYATFLNRVSTNPNPITVWKRLYEYLLQRRTEPMGRASMQLRPHQLHPVPFIAKEGIRHLIRQFEAGAYYVQLELCETYTLPPEEKKQKEEEEEEEEEEDEVEEEEEDKKQKTGRVQVEHFAYVMVLYDRLDRSQVRHTLLVGNAETNSNADWTGLVYDDYGIYWTEDVPVKNVTRFVTMICAVHNLVGRSAPSFKRSSFNWMELKDATKLKEDQQVYDPDYVLSQKYTPMERATQGVSPEDTISKEELLEIEAIRNRIKKRKKAMIEARKAEWKAKNAELERQEALLSPEDYAELVKNLKLEEEKADKLAEKEAERYDKEHADYNDVNTAREWTKEEREAEDAKIMEERKRKGISDYNRADDPDVDEYPKSPETDRATGVLNASHYIIYEYGKEVCIFFPRGVDGSLRIYNKMEKIDYENLQFMQHFTPTAGLVNRSVAGWLEDPEVEGRAVAHILAYKSDTVEYVASSSAPAPEALDGQVFVGGQATYYEMLSRMFYAGNQTLMIPFRQTDEVTFEGLTGWNAKRTYTIMQAQEEGDGDDLFLAQFGSLWHLSKGAFWRLDVVNGRIATTPLVQDVSEYIHNGFVSFDGTVFLSVLPENPKEEEEEEEGEEKKSTFPPVLHPFPGVAYFTCNPLSSASDLRLIGKAFRF